MNDPPEGTVGVQGKEEAGLPPAPDMTWIPGGTFRMGSDHHYPEEAPDAPRRRERLLDGSFTR